MKMRSKVIKRGTGSGLRYRELELCGVELENFRAFSSAQHFSIAPVTLLFGANSTGKSTVLHALGLLRQSIVSGVNPGRLLVRGQDVDFGIASEVPNRANPQDEIAIRLFFNRQEDQESKTLQEGGVLKFFTPFEEYAFEKSEKKVGLGIKAIAQTSSEGISELLLSGYEVFIGGSQSPLAEYRADTPGGDLAINRVDEEHPFWAWFAEKHAVGILVWNAVAHGRPALRQNFTFPEEFLERGAPNVFAATYTPEEKDLITDFWAQIWTSSVIGMEAAERKDASGATVLYSPILEEVIGDSRLAGKSLAGLPIKRNNGQLRNISNEIAKYIESSDGALDSIWALLGREFAGWFVRGTEPISQDVSWRPTFARKFPSWVPCGIEGAEYLELRDPINRLHHPDLDEFLGYLGEKASAIAIESQTVSARRGEFRRMFLVGEAGNPGDFDAATTSKEQLNQMNAALKHAGIPFSYGFEIFRPSEQASTDMAIAVAQVYDAFGRPKNIADVGTGTQYLLPVALALTSPNRPLLLIQEPESHLHPRMQAAVSSLIAAAGVTKNRQPLIVETHSREVLLRLLSHVEGGHAPKLKHTDLALHYIARDGDSSIVRELRIKTDGQLADPWPEGASEEGFTGPAPAK
jgi:ABC-type cobalamin/Fe3+-siderophores transport system ATPase subunit